MKAYTKPGTKYYKYSNKLNGGVVGSPTLTNGVMSGITKANYYTTTIPINGTVNTFEIRTKIKTQTTATAYAKVLSVATSEVSVGYFTNFVIQAGNDSGKIELLFWNNGTYKGAWAISSFTAGTNYWLKWVYDGNDIKGYYSTDGINYTLGATTDTADREYFRAAINRFRTANMQIGTGTQESGVLADNQTFSTGEIDLTKTFLIVNNKHIWSGTKPEPATSSDYDYSESVTLYEGERDTVTKYYKYASWTQPVLTSNTSSTEMWLEDPHLTGAKNNSGQTDIATWGTSAMGTFSNVYVSMDSNTSNVFTLSASNMSGSSEQANQIYNVFDVCFPQKMKITHIKVVCKFQNGYHCALTRVMVYAINDDGSLGTRLMNLSGSNDTTTIEKDIGNNLERKIRFCLRPDWNNGSYSCQIQEITITGQKSTSGTSSDYDYTETAYQYKIFNL